MANQGITNPKFLELLALARARRDANKPAVDQLIAITKAEQPETISFQKAGIPDEIVTTEQGKEAIVDFIEEITSSTPESTNQEGKIGTGVARAVELNTKQQLFKSTALSGDDCCLIGSAGSGKTTCTGVSIRELISSGAIGPVGESTKWLVATLPGILVCSYTRKAVNNIRRAVPEEIKQHTLTLHKVLEFQPEFFEIEDPNNPGSYKKSMQFVPKRNALNPLPAGLKVVFFEESSMIGTDLYDLWKAATPHMPQEIFIGDIQQLPPIFGPAILGFKMALLPIVELTEIYRQALQSPIIRLAHAILSGDPYLFDKRIVVRDEIHPYLKKKVARKYCPALERFDEEVVVNGELNILKFQIWQKNQDAENACNAVVQQFIAWIKDGYYDPEKDIILCPFNKSFGTVAINQGIHEYLGRQRGATVHEIIAGFNKYYWAEGDRVLYDKEDATIVSIRRNMDYMGKAAQVASVELNRDGCYVKEVSSAELEKSKQEDELSAEAVDDYLMDQFSDIDPAAETQERVNAASHAIRIRYAYSDEEVELRSSAEINNLLGGHALTVHKFQGSENESIFFVLHKSHATMVLRELLYTAVTRARSKLHIICENDSFFNGVKSQKVKGNTIEEKLRYFMGKGKFEVMQDEMRMLELMKEAKRRKQLREREEREERMRVTKENLTAAENAANLKFFEEPEKELDAEPIVTSIPAAPLTAFQKMQARLAELKAQKAGG